MTRATSSALSPAFSDRIGTIHDLAREVARDERERAMRAFWHATAGYLGRAARPATTPKPVAGLAARPAATLAA